MKAALIATVCIAIGVLPGVFYRVGQQNPPQPHHGELRELPRWACVAIVDLREQKRELFHEVVRAYTKPRDLKHSFYFEFGTGDRRACRP